MAKKFSPPAPPFISARWHGGKQTPRTIVIHGTVSPCIPGGARSVAKFFANHSQPTSAHYTVDPSEAIQSVGDHTVAYHCGYNQDSIGVELCDPQAGKDSRWADRNHVAMLERAAGLVAQLCLAYDIPIKRVTVADLKAGRHGICGHSDMSIAFRRSTHTDPGAAFPWKQFLALVQSAATDLTAAPKPAPKPARRPTTGAEILSASTVKTPSDHLTVRARLRAGKAEFVAVTANIRATPPMRAINVQRCVDLALGHDVSVVGFNEMGGRDLVALLAKHPGWTAVQGPKGDRRRAPIAYDTAAWDLVDSEVVQFSSAKVATKLGTLSVPSGNRWATIARLRHKATGVVVTFISYHGIAHFNVGSGYGWTGKGPRVLLKLRGKIPNPAITVAKQGFASLEAKIVEERAAGHYVVPMGDWNDDAFAELRDKTPEHSGPRETMRRAGVQTIYAAKKLTRGTAGKRGIDYIGIAAPKEK